MESHPVKGTLRLLHLPNNYQHRAEINPENCAPIEPGSWQHLPNYARNQ